MKNNQVILDAHKVEMIFPGVKALDKVDFRLRKGEAHSIMGENGAGKSTLIKCITGVYHKTSGTILFNGEEINPKSTNEAMDLGISTVYQEVNLCPNLSVAENIFIGREPMRLGNIHWKEINSKAKEVLRKFDIDIDVTRNLSDYSIAIQQMIAIARAVDVSAKVLILDEPTSSLDENEVRQLFDIIRRLKTQGMAIIFVSHFLDQVYEICDRITILRNGQLIGEYEADKLPKVELVNLMVGKEINELSAIHKVNKTIDEKDIILEAEDIGVKGNVEHINLKLHGSEIKGFAGLLGSGRTEVAQMLFGISKITNGQIKFKGKIAHSHTTRDAIKKRIAFCPEDRKENGVVGDLTVRENIILALQSRQGIFKAIKRKNQEEIANKYIQLLGIATPDAEKKLGQLSGGNQQKVILARWLATEPELLILDEPTRGIDVGAKADIQKLTVSLCEQGISVVFISSELDEVIRCANKVVVMRDRKQVAELDAENISQQEIIDIIAGGVS